VNLTAIVETLKRPGLLGVLGQRSEKRLQKGLEAYFHILGRKVAGLNLEQLAHDSPGHVKHVVEMRLHNTLRTTSPLLKAALEAGIQDAMLKTNHIHHYSEAAEDDTSTDYLGLTGQEAADYASQRAGPLVTGINATTQQLIADAIETGIEDMLGVQGTGKLLRDTLESMSTYRSQMIATTEMNDAMSEAMMRKLGSIGVAYKQWIAATACCDDCADNDDASPIPIDEAFPSGDMRPPAHPNCRCAVAGAQAPDA